jgi:hypothetical protein
MLYLAYQTWLLRLFHVHLGAIQTQFLNFDQSEILPKYISYLRMLETLGLKDTYCFVLPQGAEKLNKLRHDYLEISTLLVIEFEDF